MENALKLYLFSALQDGEQRTCKLNILTCLSFTTAIIVFAILAFSWVLQCGAWILFFVGIKGKHNIGDIHALPCSRVHHAQEGPDRITTFFTRAHAKMINSKEWKPIYSYKRTLAIDSTNCFFLAEKIVVVVPSAGNF